MFSCLSRLSCSWGPKQRMGSRTDENTFDHKARTHCESIKNESPVRMIHYLELSPSFHRIQNSSMSHLEFQKYENSPPEIIFFLAPTCILNLHPCKRPCVLIAFYLLVGFCVLLLSSVHMKVWTINPSKIFLLLISWLLFISMDFEEVVPSSQRALRLCGKTTSTNSDYACHSLTKPQLVHLVSSGQGPRLLRGRSCFSGRTHL